MKLLFVVKTLSTPGGGAERVLTQIATSFSRKGHDVTVLTFDRPQSPDFYPLPDAVMRKALGIGSASSSATAGDTIRRIIALRGIANDMRPDVAIGFMHSAYVPLAFACAGTGVVVIGSEHTAITHYQTRQPQLLAVRAAARLLERMTIPSTRVRASFPTDVARRMTVIANPVERSEHATKTPDRRTSKTLLAVGRLSPEKRYSLLIDAFARIAAAHRDWRLRIVGEGELRRELERQVADLGLEDRVELPGPVHPIAGEYAAADLFATSSRYESFGMATAEALAAGLPAIGFAECPGTNELIHHDLNGLLVSGADRKTALATGLDLLMSSPSLRKRMAGAAPTTVARFEIDAVLREWEGLLKRVAGNGLN